MEKSLQKCERILDFLYKKIIQRIRSGYAILHIRIADNLRTISREMGSIPTPDTSVSDPF